VGFDFVEVREYTIATTSVAKKVGAVPPELFDHVWATQSQKRSNHCLAHGFRKTLRKKSKV
jgi:hypothetical protein